MHTLAHLKATLIAARINHELSVDAWEQRVATVETYLLLHQDIFRNDPELDEVLKELNRVRCSPWHLQKKTEQLHAEIWALRGELRRLRTVRRSCVHIRSVLESWDDLSRSRQAISIANGGGDSENSGDAPQTVTALRDGTRLPRPEEWYEKVRLKTERELKRIRRVLDKQRSLV
ncbi:hypothetical protein K461DRAFT_278191 [Myriangium duriaei CBS 260.36]|uniref:Uncharacterized protein n=1 Tax=Myriangium duriaei CBS 260.36 TaxID=1168546 RepID=A0A9P4MKP7_9PEZI|nr:hypothetical protein K461DRAFT_278191 [Myriangium duriaei CBS 260.36]